MSQLERANVVEKQAATVLADALPNEPLAARVSARAATLDPVQSLHCE